MSTVRSFCYFILTQHHIYCVQLHCFQLQMVQLVDLVYCEIINHIMCYVIVLTFVIHLSPRLKS